MATEVPPWPHAAAVTETRFSTCGEDSMTAHHKGHDEPCFVRLHGDLILSHGRSRRAIRKFDHRVKVPHVADFTDVEVCSKLIHGLLAEAPETSEYDLAGDNWVDSICTPRSMATAIARFVRDEYDDEIGVPVPGLEFHIQLPELRVALAYSEPKALLLACKEAAAAETEAAGALTRGRKRLRERGGELCPVCMLDVKTEENVRLPCSHTFHDTCIERWFHLAFTCPACRRDIKKWFPAVGSASSTEEVIHDEPYSHHMLRSESPEINRDLMMRNLFGDESEGEPDIAEDEQSIGSELQLLDDESDDEAFLDSIA